MPPFSVGSYLLPSYVGEGEVGGTDNTLRGAFRRPRVNYRVANQNSRLTLGLRTLLPLDEDAGKKVSEAWLKRPGSDARTIVLPADRTTTHGPRGRRRALRTTNLQALDVSLGSELLQDRPATGSVTCWVRNFAADTVALYLFMAGFSKTDAVLFGVEADGTLSVAFGGDFLVTTNAPFIDGRWHHAALTCDGSTWRMYIDGREETLSVVSGANTGSWTDDVAGDGILTLILAQEQGGSLWDVGVQDLAVWDRMLTSTEVRQLATDPDSAYHKEYCFRLADPTIFAKPSGGQTGAAVGSDQDSLKTVQTGPPTAQATGSDQDSLKTSQAGVASAQAVGALKEFLRALQAGVPTAQAVGSDAESLKVAQTGPPTTQAVGADRESLSGTSPAGVASAQAVGALKELLAALQSGVTTAQAVGADAESLKTSQAGVPTAQALGAVRESLAALQSGVPTAQAVGALRASLGALLASGVPGAEAAGAARIQEAVALALLMAGAPTAQGVGSATFTVLTGPSGPIPNFVITLANTNATVTLTPADLALVLAATGATIQLSPSDLAILLASAGAGVTLAPYNLDVRLSNP